MFLLLVTVTLWETETQTDPFKLRRNRKTHTRRGGAAGSRPGRQGWAGVVSATCPGRMCVCAGEASAKCVTALPRGVRGPERPPSAVPLPGTCAVQLRNVTAGQPVSTTALSAHQPGSSAPIST